MIRVACLALLWSACDCGSATVAPTPPAVLEAMRVESAPTIDGELEEPAWIQTQHTERFVDARTGTREPPHTEARALCDREGLELAIYSADENIEASDRVGAVLATRGRAIEMFEVDPHGVVHWHRAGRSEPTPSGVHAAIEADGTIDEPGGNDEEWIAEIHIPWSALGGVASALHANFFRRDRLVGGTVRSLAWIAWRDRPSSDPSTLGTIRCASPTSASPPQSGR